MTDQRVYETLIGIGVSAEAARAYVLIADLGSTDLATLRSGLRISRNRTQAAIHELERKGFITVAHGPAPRYVRNEDPKLLEILRRASPDGVRGSSFQGSPDGLPDGPRRA